MLEFPYPPSSLHYALLKTNMPALTALTVCLWAKTDDANAAGYMFSYATGNANQANHIVISAMKDLNIAILSQYSQARVSFIIIIRLGLSLNF